MTADPSSGSPGTPGPDPITTQSRRDFLRRLAGTGYTVPAVLTLSIADFYDEETGYSLAQAATPPGWEHHPHH
ncbi:MAG: hypothetical protein R6W82_03895 [bacterium]